MNDLISTIIDDACYLYKNLFNKELKYLRVETSVYFDEKYKILLNSNHQIELQSLVHQDEREFEPGGLIATTLRVSVDHIFVVRGLIEHLFRDMVTPLEDDLYHQKNLSDLYNED